MATSVLPPRLAAQAVSTARQRAAIQKACQSGALSPEECQAKLAALGGSAPAAAAPANGAPAESGGSYAPGRPLAGGSVWRHPNGLYSLSVPAGWHVDESTPDHPKLVNGDTWAIFDTSASNSEAIQVAQREADQMKTMLSDWKVYNQGSFTTRAGHGAGGITAGCTLATRTGSVPRVMIFATQTDGQHHFVTMTSSTAASNSQATNGTLMQIFESIRFAGE